MEGWSPCRVCRKKNGTNEYKIEGQWAWPEGFTHYIEDHKVIIITTYYL